MAFARIVLVTLTTLLFASLGVRLKQYHDDRKGTIESLMVIAQQEHSAVEEVRIQCQADVMRECESPRFLPHPFLPFVFQQDHNPFEDVLPLLLFVDTVLKDPMRSFYIVDSSKSWMIATSHNDDEQQDQSELNQQRRQQADEVQHSQALGPDCDYIRMEKRMEERLQRDDDHFYPEDQEFQPQAVPQQISSDNSLLQTMRRRLTEVSPQASTTHAIVAKHEELNNMVPSYCLETAFVEQRVRPTCGMAIQNLQSIRFKRNQLRAAFLLESNYQLESLVSIYAFFFIVALALLLPHVCDDSDRDNSEDEDDLEVCVCCCCGASSDNQDEFFKDSCCGCCQGTGVCSPNCADCCGGKTAARDTNKTNNEVACCGKKTNSNEVACCGKTCCANGCCGCCCCSSSKASCCGEGCCCCGCKKSAPKTCGLGQSRSDEQMVAVYEAVPMIQIV